MSEQEIKEYMIIYFEMMLEIPSWKEDDSRFKDDWYINWKKTGIMDNSYLSNDWEKKLKNKRYQLSKGNLDQSFLIWRIMKSKQDELINKPMMMIPNESNQKLLATYLNK